MAFCSIASAASGFVVKSNINTFETITIKSNITMFPSKNTRCSRLVVQTAEEAAATQAAGATSINEDNSIPPPIGPKRGTKVRILRKESYWCNSVGSVVTVDQDPNARYPVVVRFNKLNYANVSTNNYGLDEIEVV
ncbi:hypothetical protein L2E82_00362 [Cichorium intybus]|uniref:Uncharacterized protein n=1 Tax=Cichorium intybus TaxID=13427 RepID=A0ACB9GXF7_CICIN|nr:hypothetical protein L2E82_00362 [Cichorium intybus]